MYMELTYIQLELVSTLVLHWGYEQCWEVILAHHSVPTTHALVGLEVWQLLENSNKSLLLLVINTETLVDRVELVAKLGGGGVIH